jgi:hypothetical protein
VPGVKDAVSDIIAVLSGSCSDLTKLVELRAKTKVVVYTLVSSMQSESFRVACDTLC